MLRGLLSDIPVYLRLIAMQIRAQAQYKTNLAIDIATYFFTTVAEFAAILLLFSSFATMVGWTLGEVALLYALVSLSFGVAEMVSAGIDLFPETVRLGDFDRVLLRPVGAFVQVAGSGFRLRRLGRISEGLLILIFALRLLPAFHWTLLKGVMLLLGILSGGTLFLAVFLLGSTLCFWTIDGDGLTNILTYGARELLSFPLTVYSRVFQGVFLFVVPLAFGSYLPACFLLNKSVAFGLPRELVYAAPVVTVAFVLIAGVCWRYGVRRYQSTGS